MLDKKVIRSRIRLVLNRPFYGSLVMKLKLQEWGEDTFATDGTLLYYPKNYTYEDKELITIVAHETLHCALGHVFRRGNRDPLLWNIAADYATNLILSEDTFFALPQDALLNKQYKGKTVEQIYEILKKNAIKVKLRMKDILEPGNGDAKSKSDSEISEALAQDWKDALAHAAEKNKGDIPGGLSELIKTITEPKIPWQQVLFRYLQTTKGNTDYTAYPFNRAHLYRDIYLPSMRGESIEVCCAIDTSGSMSSKELQHAFSEIRGICGCFGEYTIHFWQIDAAIQEELTITSDSEIPTIVKGRGGTSFIPIFKRIEELYLEDLPLIYITDLEGSFPKSTNVETFWVTETNNKAPFGTIIKLPNK